jgi:leader peptidase (prepilin peptidase) / N-methyltransferase
MSLLSGSMLFLVIFCIFSIPASIIDIKHKRIPDCIVFPGIITLLVFSIFYIDSYALRVFTEMLAGSTIFYCIRLISKRKLGMGDVKFAALMAVFLGFPGWFVAAGLASLLGLVFAILNLCSGRINKNTKIPFAPFLTVGSIAAYFIQSIVFNFLK